MQLLTNFISFNAKAILEIIDWRTFFDVPIIALFIFFLYHTLRTSGAWRIVLGLLIGLAIFIIARMFHLTGITWIFSNVSNIALIALIIIFQPEIRKIFEKAATTLRIKETGTPAKELSTLITDAAIVLARKRWGAIFVLPGKDSIRPRVSGGIEINAKPSLALITSIFDPHSSGHDGAIVIENGIITDFALRLPLSVTEKLGAEFGTRHHAAMGLSENTDALVIAVSEERGKISLFHEGQYFPVDEKKKLISRIDSHWGEIGSRSPIKHRLKKQGMLFLEIAFSVIIAFALWTSIILSNTRIKEMSFAIPIEYMIATSDMVIAGEKPTAVRIKVSGSTSDITQIKPNELRASIDLSKSKPGKQLITISKNNIHLPGGVNLIDAEPSVFEINLQSFVEREVMVRPQIIGQPPKGFDVSSILINPEKIKILCSSDQNEPNEIYLTTTPIYIQNITANTKLMCSLIAPPNIYPVDKQWPDVVVSITLKAVKK